MRHNSVEFQTKNFRHHDFLQTKKYFRPADLAFFLSNFGCPYGSLAHSVLKPLKVSSLSCSVQSLIKCLVLHVLCPSL